MTLDEAIKHAEEVADLCEYEASKYDMSDSYESYVACQNGKCATEHRQLAEWLKELKQLREQTKWIPTSVRPPKPFELVVIQDSCGGYDLAKYIPSKIRPKKHPDGYWGEVDGINYDYFDIEAWYSLPKEYRPEGNDKYTEER